MSRKRVLIADDETAILSVLSYKLSSAGLDVITASDGLQALELAKSEHPDLMIMDFQMPGLTGLEVCLQLRADPATSNIKAIMLTACGMDVDQADLERADIALLMPKPFSPREVLSRAQDLLNTPCVGQLSH
ncbi:MAG: response regulator [Actinobacteria bacterium]|nr:response regulator [Actinomycetota bacterium]